MKVYFAADHAGFELKNKLINFVRGDMALEVEDCGAFEFDVGDDYPTIIDAAARKLSADMADGRDNRAIILGATGQGEAMVANRYPRVRAAVYYGEATGEQLDAAGRSLDMLTSTRIHNNANALSLAARFLAEDEAKGIVRQWLSTPFPAEERHARRILQIDKLS
jgi:ribose 5-phosphate isomerase B